MSGRKLTNKEVDKRLKKTNTKRIGDVIGSRKPMLCECKKCGYRWSPNLRSEILSGEDGCPECARLSRHLSIDEVDRRLAKRSLERVGEYNGVLKKMTCRCKVCEYKWEGKAVNVMGGTGCPNCAAVKNRQPRLSSTEIDRRLKRAKIEMIGECFYVRDATYFKCKVCENEWKTTLTIIINAGSGCPMCATRKSEKEVATLLKKYKVEFIHHQKLHEIMDIKRLLIVDYYLPNHNMIIEYNGHQHYLPVRWHGMSKKKAKSVFKKQKSRDVYVKRLCKKKDITLISIDGRKYNYQNLEPFMKDLIAEHLKKKDKGKENEKSSVYHN